MAHVSLRAYARHRGISAEAVSKAVACGRLARSVVVVAGQPKLVSIADADIEWVETTRARPLGPRAKREKKRHHPSIVYFIQCATGPGSGPIKIGTTADVAERLKTLQCASAFRLHVLATTEGDRHLERELHRRLAAHRMRGEWFRDHAEVRAAIWELAAV